VPSIKITLLLWLDAYTHGTISLNRICRKYNLNLDTTNIEIGTALNVSFVGEHNSIFVSQTFSNSNGETADGWLRLFGFVCSQCVWTLLFRHGAAICCAIRNTN